LNLMPEKKIKFASERVECSQGGWGVARGAGDRKPESRRCQTKKRGRGFKIKGRKKGNINEINRTGAWEQRK